MSYENWNGEDVLLEDYDDSYLDTDFEDYDDDYDDYEDDYDDDYEDNFDEDYEDDLSEKRRRWSLFKGRSKRKNARGARGRRFGKGRKSPYRGKGIIRTPAGSAKVSLPRNLATQQQLAALEKKVLANNKAILGNGKAINTLNSSTKRLDSGLISQAKKTDGIGKKISGIQQGQLFSAILPPKLTEVTINKETGEGAVGSIDDSKTQTASIKSAKFDTMSSLLPALMSGGLGGTSSGGKNDQMNMMLPLVLLMTQNNNNSGGSNDNTTLLLVLAMTMMNK